MIVTSKDYRNYISDNANSALSRKFTAKATITLTDGTILEADEKDIVVNGLKFNDSTSISNSFQVGSAIINRCTLLLNNIGGKFDGYDFTKAEIRPYVGLKLPSKIEWINKGVFEVDESLIANSVLQLIALDNMNKFDIPFSNVSISFPCTEMYLLQKICIHCGVALTRTDFLKDNYIIEERPLDEAITCREVVSWIAQNNGCFARCNIYGFMELKWYDVGAFGANIYGGTFDKEIVTNILENTEEFTDLEYWSLSKGDGQEGYIDIVNDTTYGNVLHFVKSNNISWCVTNNQLFSYFNNFDTTKKYTISFLIKSLNSTNIEFSFKDATGANAVSENFIVSTSTEWTRVTKKFVPLSTGNEPVFYLMGEVDEYFITELVLDEIEPYSSGDSVDGGDFTFSEITNYSGGTFSDMDRYHHIYSLQSSTIATDDIVITGIQVIVPDTEESFLYGTEDYVLTIKNPLINNGDAEYFAYLIGRRIVGMRFRPLSISALSDPSIEAGDVAYVSDRKGNSYQILVTNLSYSIGNFENITCDAETVSKKQSTQYTPEAKAVVEAKAIVEKETTAREEAIAELNRVISESGGLYYTVETLPNGSKIHYMHDKPTIVASSVVWKMTADAIGVSTDGGVTYPTGMTADGDAIVNRLNAHTVIGVRLEGSTLISQSPTNTTRRVEIADGLITVGDRSGTYAELDGGGLYFRSSGSNGTTIYNGYVGATAMQCQTLNNYAPITMGNYTTYTQTAYIIQSDSVSAYLIAYSNASSGNLTGATAGYVKAYVTAQSDERLKENIVQLDDVSEKYMKLNPISYTFKDGGGNDKRTNFGFIAQEIDKLFDREDYSLVTEDHNPLEGQEQYCEDYVLTLNQNNLHAMHVKMIQSQQKRIELLENELSELKKLLIEKGVI